MASVYGGPDGYCGSPTANGERVDCSAMTAAHRRLPFGARVRVCHSGCVTVRINDRGPWVRGRDIDLSPAAARAIGLDGTGPVADFATVKSSECSELGLSLSISASFQTMGARIPGKKRCNQRLSDFPAIASRPPNSSIFFLGYLPVWSQPSRHHDQQMDGARRISGVGISYPQATAHNNVSARAGEQLCSKFRCGRFRDCSQANIS